MVEHSLSRREVRGMIPRLPQGPRAHTQRGLHDAAHATRTSLTDGGKMHPACHFTLRLEDGYVHPALNLLHVRNAQIRSDG